MTGDCSAVVEFLFAFALFSIKTVHPSQTSAAGHCGTALGTAHAVGSRP